MENAILIIVSLFWSIFWAVVNYNLAAKYNRGTFKWSISGFIFGLFSTVILLIKGKNENEEVEEVDTDSLVIKVVFGITSLIVIAFLASIIR